MQALTNPSMRRTMSRRAWYWDETIPMKICPLRAWIQSSFSITSPIPSSGMQTICNHRDKWPHVHQTTVPTVGESTMVIPRAAVPRHTETCRYTHTEGKLKTSICPSIPSHRGSFRTSPHMWPSVQVRNRQHGKEKDKTEDRDQSQRTGAER